LAIREETNSLQTLGGLLLLMSYGATLRKLGDQEGMLSQYNRVRKLKKGLKIEVGPVDIQLLVEISAAASELGQKKWALDSFLKAERIRKKLGLAQSAEGTRLQKTFGSKVLSRCPEEDDLVLNVTDVPSPASKLEV